MRTALLLLGYNRLDYFEKTITSLENNTEAHQADLHVYLDGGPNAKQSEIIKLVNESKFQNPVIVTRDENWGIGRHLIDARRELFDNQKYDRVVLFEDDMTLNSDYLRTVLSLDDWTSKYSDVGTVMAFNLNSAQKKIQSEQLQKIIFTNRHFWGYCMRRTVWEEIKEILYEYESKYLTGIDYSSRPHRRIRFFFIRRWMKQGRNSRGGNPLSKSKWLNAPFPKWPWRSPTSQDAITALALWVKGYCRITTVVSRAKYIGEKGLHFSPEVFTKHGFHQQQVFDFSNESQVLDFQLDIETLQDGSAEKHYV